MLIQLRRRWLGVVLVTTLASAGCVGARAQHASPAPTATASRHQAWQEDFELSSRKLESTGESRYFILRPGFQLVLASATGNLTITVLKETKEIGGVTTRVIEEREEQAGTLVEVSRNFFAMDPQTGDAFYFGEEVDTYSNGELTGHGGSWLAYDGENRPGLIMPGSPEVGMKYYQESAPGVAADRARIVSLSETMSTRAGDFENCLLTQESSPVEPGAIEYKTYCPGVGLVQDEGLTLVSVHTVQ
jgi:hypothetical protein